MTKKGEFDPKLLYPKLRLDIELEPGERDVLIAHYTGMLADLRRELESAVALRGELGPNVVEIQARIADATFRQERILAQSVDGIAAASLPAEAKKPPRKRKEPGTVSRADLKIIEASAQIMNPPEGEDMAFTHSVLCQVGLPRKAFSGREFMRVSGAAWINVQAGWLDEGQGPVQQPIPYGPLPRLALAWISTQAVREKTREIQIGDSASEFLRLLGKPTTGGKRGSFTTLRKQMHALAACRLQLGFKGRTYNGQPVEQFDAWITNKDSEQQALWPGVMVLSDGYFSSLLDSAVPLDNRALLALSDSALALDVYAWLAHRLHRIEGRGVTLHWKALREQFAQEYQGKDPDKDFKDAFLHQLKKVLAVYPQAKVKPVVGGLLLLGSPPPVAYK